jgi:hypothetical protein
MMSEAKRKRIEKLRKSGLAANNLPDSHKTREKLDGMQVFCSHKESFNELIQSISESLRHQDGKTIQDCARLCGLDVTYLGNFQYEVKHG